MIKPDKKTLLAIDAFLQEGLIACGVSIQSLAPHEIATGMKCSVFPDGSMQYSWHDTPILQALPPEKEGEEWRIFAKEQSLKST